MCWGTSRCLPEARSVGFFRRPLAFLFSPAFLAAALFLQACSLAITGTVRQDASASLAVRADFQPKTAALLRSLDAGEDGGGAVVDAGLIAESLAASPGVRSARLENRGGSALDGEVLLSDIGAFARAAPDGTRAADIAFESTAGGGSFRLVLTRENGARMLAALSRDLADYVSVLLAPIATGEALTKKEYLELAGSVYGAPVAAEIAAARVRITLEFPAKITSAEGLRYTGKQAALDVPLADVLTLETPLRLAVTW